MPLSEMTPDNNDDSSRLHFGKDSPVVHGCLNDLGFFSKPEIFVSGSVHLGDRQKRSLCFASVEP